RLGGRNVGVLLHTCDVGLPHVDDVLVLVPDLPDGEAHDVEPHLVEILRARVPHALTDGLGILHDGLHGELTHDPAQMAFHDQADQPFAFFGSLAEELLRRGKDAFVVGLDLDLRYGLDRHPHALLGVEVLLRGHVEGHQLERQLTRTLDHRPDDRAAPTVDARTTQAVDDQRLVRPYLSVELGHHAQDGEGPENDQADDDPEPHVHRKLKHGHASFLMRSHSWRLLPRRHGLSTATLRHVFPRTRVRDPALES